MNHRPSTLTTLLLTRLGLSPNSTARASKSRARHLLAPFAIAAMLLGLAGNANAQALSFGAEPSIDDQVYTVGQAVDVTLPAGHRRRGSPDLQPDQDERQCHSPAPRRDY